MGGARCLADRGNRAEYRAGRKANRGRRKRRSKREQGRTLMGWNLGGGGGTGPGGIGAPGGTGRKTWPEEKRGENGAPEEPWVPPG